MTQSLKDRLQALLQAHVGHAFTGAVLLVQDADGDVVALAVGTVEEGANTEPVQLTTPFDLASLTKLFTSAAVLRLVDRGDLRLDSRVQDYLPLFQGRDKDRVTVRHLLSHTSGLSPLIRLFGSESAGTEPWETIFAFPLSAPPGDVVQYSDVGYMLLGRLVEQQTGSSLRAAMRSLVLDPLGLSQVSYGPCSRAAATELDPWRGRRLRGEVHDENAAVLGGAAGHAGLFGPAAQVAALARAFTSADTAFLSPGIVRQAITEHARTGDERRGLGWKLRSDEPDAPDFAFTADSFGHYGYTGTALWHDPGPGMTVTFLTNRVYYGRDPSAIHAVRQQVFSAISRSFRRRERLEPEAQ